MNNCLAIECLGLSKKFRWYERSQSLKESFTRIFQKSKEKYEWYVLKDLNLEIKKGEMVGIIGRNGSGKTTLLKIFSDIYSPSAGSVNINCSRRLALIELGVGFYEDLTGRENVTLNWVFNGLPKEELSAKFKKIVKFAGVEKFLDTPLKYYSSGMKARLGFAIAINADPDLLIIDEILAVGDAEFQQKCYKEIERLCRNNITLIFVSHNESDVAKVCKRVIWLDEGKIRFDGNAQEALKRYRKTITDN
ncbi:MAG TPA: ABC transporter ATP-binding protein [Ignavibacteriaceae bacterium]|nr:ABC transporter ATP-binding protein [Ignavibacteriaceae bacterium]